MIVATAGHVDHGKTSLVKQLSGIDTDRLAEEKRRGLSINLGFAYERIADKVSIGYIDVPGHNRFINTMISGVSGIDMALLVVAADDGPMPQTIEHLEVLRLLGVTEFVLVITRIDRVEQPRVDGVIRDLRKILAADCPVFPVSNIDGTGVSQLRFFLHKRAQHIGMKPDCGYFRLSIDRVFLLQGTGLVVTGTIISGRVVVGDQIRLMPGGLPVRVRGIYAQDEKAQSGRAGQRCALNITGVGRQQIDRGDWLQAPALSQASERIDVRLDILASAPFAIKHLSPVKLYIGAKRLPARLYLLEEPGTGNALEAGDRVLAQLNIQSEVACCRGDRFLLRDDSESITLGGGVILDPRAPRTAGKNPLRLAYLAAMEAGYAELALEQLLFEQHRLLDFTHFKQAWNLRDEEANGLLSRPALKGRLEVFASEGVDYVIASENWVVAEQTVTKWLRAWHQENPRSDGAQLKLLRSELENNLQPALFLAVVSKLIKRGLLKLVNGLVSLADHKVTASIAELAHWRVIERALNKHGVRIPVLSELQKELSLDDRAINQAFRLAVKEGRAFQLGKKRFILSQTIADLARTVNELAGIKPEFSIIEFKNHAGLGRNVAIELMEYFDSIRFTARRGDKRSVIDAKLPERYFKQAQ